MIKKLLIIVFSALLLFDCNNGKVNKKKSSGEIKNHFVLNKLSEISSPEYSFGESKILEVSNAVVIRDENGNGLFIFKVSSKKLKKISDRSVREFQTFDSQGLIFYLKKIIANPPKYKLKKYSLKSGVTAAILNSERRIRFLQKIGEGYVLYWVGNKAFLYDLKSNRISKVERSRRKFFYYGIERNNFIIHNNGKTKKFNFPNGRIIWADINVAKKIAVVYTAPKGTFVLSDKGEIFAGDLRTPKISPNGMFVTGMRESYDNQKILRSDIFVYNLQTKELINLTNSGGEIELNPDWSSDGNFISYSTPKGKVKILKFSKAIKNFNNIKKRNQ